MVRYPPPWHLVSHRHTCAIPHFAKYRAIIVRYPIIISTKDQGQVSAEGILHLVNPNLGSNSGIRIFEPRILGPNSGVEFFGPMFSNKAAQNSHPKIHPRIRAEKFTLLEKQIFVPVPAGRHFLNFFRPDSGPPPIHMLLQRK